MKVFIRLCVKTVSHWFWKIDNEYEKKNRFELCQGCRQEWIAFKDGNRF